MLMTSVWQFRLQAPNLWSGLETHFHSLQFVGCKNSSKYTFSNVTFPHPFAPGTGPPRLFNCSKGTPTP